MHPQALDWVHRWSTADPVSVLDIGGRDINGTARVAFPNATEYVVLDIADGPNVDIVTDASTWTPDREYDVVVCCEVFEHTASWPQICRTAYEALKPDGRLILTMAGPGRPAHSGVDGGWSLYPGEHYANVEPGALRGVLEACGFAGITVDQQSSPADVRATAVR